MTRGQPIEIVPDEVQALGRFAYEVAEQLRSGSTTVDGAVQGLFSTWRGSAAESYRTGWDEMERGAVRVWDALFEMAEKLGVTAESFKSQDAATASTVSSLELD